MLLADIATEYPFFADRVSAGIAIIRVIVGVTVAAHGYAHFFRGGRIAGTGRWFDSMGMKPGKFHAYLASVTEIVAGLLFAVGLLTPLAAAGVIGLMVVAGWTVHRENGFFSVADGWEYVFVVATVAAGIAATGPGEFSLDYEFGLTDSDFDGPKGLAIAAGGGLLAAIAQLGLFYRPPPKVTADEKVTADNEG